MLQKRSEGEHGHVPVLLNEVLGYLNLSAGKTILDATIGYAGHASKILELIAPNGFLIGIDKDIEALNIAKNNLSAFDGKYVLLKDDFRNLERDLSQLNINKLDGILFDLGVSSLQLEKPERGFSIRYDGPLDMRMDASSQRRARDLVNSCSFDELVAILKEFGEEPKAKSIARLIIEHRKKIPLTTTRGLRDLVEKAYHYKRYKIHPATKTFQAFRIAVNDELESLKSGLEKIVKFMAPASRLCVISFHSLEDRIVKNYFKKLAISGVAKIITKKPVTPSKEEMENNPRSRSAKLRVIEKVN